MIRVLIMGAAGRDFHNFNVFFRSNPRYKVMGFTAAQIPNISKRRYPPALSGRHYPKGIPIYPEKQLERLIKKLKIDQVIFSYSDVLHVDVMHKASLVNAAGADFRLLGPNHTMIQSKKPLIAICAVRTGSGKSQTTRYIAEVLHKQGKRVVVIRHPMPYGDLTKQQVQRFATFKDLDRHHCTIEEREEYAPHIRAGTIVYAGVDFERILRQAEKEADVILWDGGNNDFSFYRPDLWITIVDPHRPGHELLYYPGEMNLLAADVILINKEKTATKKNIAIVMKNIKTFNPKAIIIHAESRITLEGPPIKRKRVLVVEDGPTLTHGGMPYGAGIIAARRAGAVIVRPKISGSIKKVFEKFPHLGNVLPAMGYGKKQIKELENVINQTPCDLVITGTPIDLSRVLKANKPILRARYVLKEIGRSHLKTLVQRVTKRSR